MVVFCSQMVLAGDKVIFIRSSSMLESQIIIVDLSEQSSQIYADGFSKFSYGISYDGDCYVLSRDGKLFWYGFDGMEKQLTFNAVPCESTGSDAGLSLTSEANIMPVLNAGGKKLVFLKTKLISRPLIYGAVCYMSDINSSSVSLRTGGYTTPVWLNDGCILAAKVEHYNKAEYHCEEIYSVPRLLYLDGRDDVKIANEEVMAKGRILTKFSSESSNGKQFFFKKERYVRINDNEWDEKYQIVLMNAGDLSFVKEFTGATDGAWCGDKLILVNKDGRGDNVGVYNSKGEVIKKHRFGHCGVHEEIYDIVGVNGNKIYIHDGGDHMYVFDVEKGKEEVINLYGYYMGR